MQRDPQASVRAREAERRADEKSGLISIKPMKLGGGTPSQKAGFKKGGFKNAFGGGEVAVKQEEQSDSNPSKLRKVGEALAPEQDDESESDDDPERYDPRYPTDCFEDCPSRT